MSAYHKIRQKVFLGAACAAIAAFAAAAPGAAEAQSASFGYTGGLQYFAAPTTGVCDITAFGAQGGPSGGNTPGGLGAEIGGDVTLTSGQQLTILVRGDCPLCYGGGGGGSFLANPVTEVVGIDGTNAGNGFAYIDFLGPAPPPVPAPRPGAGLLSLAALILMGGIGKASKFLTRFFMG